MSAFSFNTTYQPTGDQQKDAIAQIGIMQNRAVQANLAYQSCLVAGNQHKRRITGGIFQPGCRSLLNERVIEPQCFTVRNQNAFIRLCHMPVE